MSPAPSPATITGLSLAALAALALAACGPDDTLDTSGDGEPNSTVTIGADEDGTADRQADEAQGHEDAESGTEDHGDAGSTDASTDETEADTGEPAASETADHPLYGGLETVQAEYPDGVVFEVEADDARYEWHVYVDGVEREVHTDFSSLEIVYTEDDDTPDDDDLREIEAIEIDIAEAFRIVEDHAGDPSGAFVDEAQLDTSSGTVVWDIELTDGHEIAVDVVTGDLVQVDD